MILDVLPEPELEFAAGRHVDIRFGLTHLGPVDGQQASAPKEIKLGLVGTPHTLESLTAWLERCRAGVAAKEGSRQPNLFPAFPGFGSGSPLAADLVTPTTLQRRIGEARFKHLYEMSARNALVDGAVDLFLGELESLAEKGVAQVFIVAPPLELALRTLGKADETDEESPEEAHDFHHLLKARAMRLGRPLQLVLPTTYDASVRLPQARRPDRVRVLQDAATRAWNFYTALYYKAGGTPWRLVRESSQPATCYVGVSFYRTLDAAQLRTSSAHVFNELGEGIILRGGPVRLSKEDLQPHLNRDDANALLAEALVAYRAEHHTVPARLVLLKTSEHNLDELAGFKAAIAEKEIDSADILSIRASGTRLVRDGAYPPLRGTFLSKDDHTHTLYSKGSVDFYATYPGLYIPRPIEFTCADCEQTPRVLAREILALTKMNWNSTQFDNSDPIVVAAARKVGGILKYVGNDEAVQRRYSFYM